MAFDNASRNRLSRPNQDVRRHATQLDVGILQHPVDLVANRFRSCIGFSRRRARSRGSRCPCSGMKLERNESVFNCSAMNSASALSVLCPRLCFTHNGFTTNRPNAASTRSKLASNKPQSTPSPPASASATSTILAAGSSPLHALRTAGAALRSRHS
jgi:hypothetical protein